MKTRPILSALALCIVMAFHLSSEDQPGPVIAHWTLDDPVSEDNVEVKDSGPNQLHGELKNTKGVAFGVKSVKAMRGNGLEFSDGHAAWIELPLNELLDLLPPFTIVAWIKPAQTGDRDIFNRKWDSATEGYRLRYHSSFVAFDLGDASQSERVNSPPSSVEIDHWAHVAVTHDGKQVRLFVNGAEVAAKPVGLTPATIYGGKPIPVTIGNYVGKKDAYPFVGQIDEMMIFGKALSGAELVALGASQNQRKSGK